MQDIKCEQKNVAGNASSASVSTMFRMRYGLKNMTFVAEGIWKSTSRQLCMAGCLGLVDVDGSLCNSRICLYVPISFFIKERNIFMEVYPAPITVVCIASAAYRDVELFQNLSSKLQIQSLFKSAFLFSQRLNIHESAFLNPTQYLQCNRYLDGDSVSWSLVWALLVSTKVFHCKIGDSLPHKG
ncbi:hypothetical protein ACFX11_046751 [Malus domestica]